VNEILGLHHVTAIASDPQGNLDFYSGLLGMRLVKRTVNFDDPQTYHLYYGDDVGTPGGIMTFFPWPGARRGRVGAGQVGVTSFAVLPGALPFWSDRLAQHGVSYEDAPQQGDGPDERAIAFNDPDGTRLRLVEVEGVEQRRVWESAKGIPRDRAIHGFHGVTLLVREHGPTERVIVETLGFHLVAEWGHTRRYATAHSGREVVDVRVVEGRSNGVPGAGTVHHVAFAVESDATQLVVRERVAHAALQPTPVIDRTYFHSVYFREPEGILFELATNPPGFLIDEPANALGERLMLPRQFERNRGAIEGILPMLHLPVSDRGRPEATSANGPEAGNGNGADFVHRYVSPAASGNETASKEYPIR
jgi:glyoxalase family protein